MFYLTYLKAELFRRWGKTLIVALGLSVASAIIIAIISISQGLSNSQEQVLNPLENVGTDIMITRSVDTQNMGELDQATRNELASENWIKTDLSKLGEAGEDFSLDTFLTGTMLTFSSDETKKLTPDLAKEYAEGLILNVTHQEGKIPTITAEFETGGEKVELSEDIAPLTAAEEQAIASAKAHAAADLIDKGIDPKSEEGGKAIRNAVNAAMPERFKKANIEYTTPRKTYRKTLDTPQTDIQTETFTIAGVDTSKEDIGLILPSQITEGSYFNNKDQTIVNLSYAQKKGLKTGDSITINDKNLKVVGIVDPKFYTNTAGIYVPLSDLQDMANKKDLINILLIKAPDAQAVEATSAKIASFFPGAKITDSKDTAEQVTGSLVSAASLMSRFIGLISTIVILAAFIIVSLITISSVNKRTQELGTLKAIGWKNSLLVRQILLENLVIGLVGALFGIGFGLGIIILLNYYDITLTADVVSSNTSQDIIRRFIGSASGSTANIKLDVTYNYLILLVGALVAIVGSVVAGGLAAFRASRMKPQEALRQI
jgi:ABC-type antimicrobial peptide transport system permease subunit